ncbi:MAG: hydroxypyruvate isomerase, partial [Planctomycetota bacterium]
DMPRYFLVDLPTARRVIKAVNAPNLGLQFDAYHIKQRGGDLVQDWAANRDLARHVQIAGTPGRHEPMPSEINYALFFQQLDSDGYDGFVSGEYHPRGATLAGLNWLNPTSP